MKVLHVSSPVSWRGGERQVFYLMTGLAEQMIPQALLCPEGSPLSGKCRDDRLPFYTLPGPFGKNLIWARKIRALVRRQSFDIIHAHDPKAHGFAVLSNLLFGMDTPIIVTRRVQFPVRKNWFTRLKYNHPHIRDIICISNAVAEEVRKAVPGKQLSVIPSCVDIHKFEHVSKGDYLATTYPFSASSCKIGYIATLTPEKDHYTFIDIAERILAIHKNVVFFIIGDGKMKPELENYVKKARLEQNVIFTGFIREPDKIIPELDLLLFTSASEGLSSTILDFFLAKIPVVSTNAGGIKDLISDGETGFLCPVKDTDCLAQSVTGIISGELSTKQITENAYKEVMANYNIEHITQKTLAVYQKCLLRI